MNSVVFVDRDGTIIREPRDKQIDSLEKLEFVPGVVAGLRLLKQHGFRLVMVTNQDGLGSSSYPRKKFDLVQKKVISLLAGEGIKFDAVFVCPHRSKDNCLCRKPKTGLLEGYLKKNPIDPSSSFVFGDRMTDVQLAENLRIRAVRLAKPLVKKPLPEAAVLYTRDAFEACRAMVSAARTCELRRTTHETDIVCRVLLSGEGRSQISTGIGFFDHMLEQLARHSGIDIELKVDGDLHIDEHHTVEDAALVLGQALRKALGSKLGIGRYGFVMPMDEARSLVALDLSGRPSFQFEVEFRREQVGGLPTEMIEHFFRSLAESLGASLHIVCSGRNEHHKIESMFKGVARALGQAVHLPLSGAAQVPSSKGVLA